MKLNVQEIKKLIPHRHPFLFIDTCEIIVPGEHGISDKLFSSVIPKCRESMNYQRFKTID